MNKILKFTICYLLLLNCSSIKTIYGEQGSVTDITSKILLEKLSIGENESLITFTSGFNGDEVKILNEGKVVFSRNLKTIEQLGFAGSCVIKNFQSIIYINNNRKIIINETKLSKYKFIDIAYNRNKKQYIVTFGNKAKTFR